MVKGIMALVLGLAGNLAAQGQPSAGQWANVASLAPGTEVRVTLSSGKPVGGKLQGVASDSLAIQASASRQTLSRGEIKRVEAKGKGRRRRNALIGLAIGAGAGLGIGAAVDRSDAQSSFNFHPNIGKAAITPLGAIIGVVVGLAIPTGGWREIFRAP